MPTGEYLGKFRKIHIPHCNPGFWEKFYFRPGNLGYPVFDTKIGKVGVYICYDRHFPDGARCLGLNGAEIVFNPSATVAGLSEYLWKLEQPAHAVANQYFVGAINRPGWEEPWRIGEFYGQSYFVDPRGQFIAQSEKRTEDDIVIADMDFDMIREVRNYGNSSAIAARRLMALSRRSKSIDKNASHCQNPPAPLPLVAEGLGGVSQASSPRQSRSPSSNDCAQHAPRHHIADKVIVHRHQSQRASVLPVARTRRAIAASRTKIRRRTQQFAPHARRGNCPHHRQLRTGETHTRRCR